MLKVSKKIVKSTVQKENVPDNIVSSKASEESKKKAEVTASPTFDSEGAREELSASESEEEQKQASTAKVQGKAAAAKVKFGSRMAGNGKKPPRSLAKKAGLVFPVFHILKRLKKGHYANKIQKGAAVYMAAMLEYLASESLELAGNAAAVNHKKRIIPRHIKLAFGHDEELSKLVKNVTFAQGGVVPYIHSVLLPKNSKSSSKNVSK